MFDLPEEILSDSAISLLKGIIVVDPSKRLSIAEIKQHEFFEGLEWGSVDRLEL